MKGRSLLAAAGMLAVLAVLAVTGPAAVAAPGTSNPPATTPAKGSVTPASTPAGAASPGAHTLTRTERAVLLVTLTFLVGAGLLGPADTEGDHRSKRPAITLYDDPALVERTTPTRRPAGEPPPLR